MAFEGPGKTPADRAAWIRGMTRSRLSRRQFMRGAAGAAALAAFGPALAACGVGGTANTGSDKDFDWAAWWQEQKPTNRLTFANWPLYIDTEKGRHPTLLKFEKQTGIKVDYQPVIQDNAEFFSKISPTLKAGNDTGYDIIVMSNGYETEQLMANRWLTPLDHSQLPNFNKYRGEVTNLNYDPDNTYNAVWQAGITGIGYNPEMTGGEIDSIEALWDPKFKGKIGMLNDDDELGAAGLLALGINPETSTHEDWEKAAAKLTEQRDAGLVRQYYDQGYIDALKSGNIALGLAYSGDIFQANMEGYPNLKFVVPKEGAMLWHDCCQIPLHAKNPVSALKLIDFYYDPVNQAALEDWVNFICPVPAAQEIIREKLDDPEVADSPLVFPTDDMMERLYGYPKNTTPETNRQWTDLMDPIMES